MAAPYFGKVLGLALACWDDGVSGALSVVSCFGAIVIVSGIVSFFCILVLLSAFSWVVGGAGAGAGADVDVDFGIGVDAAGAGVDVDADTGSAGVVVLDFDCCGDCCCTGRSDTLGTWPSFPANQS